jgi:hypothetical protein
MLPLGASLDFTRLIRPSKEDVKSLLWIMENASSSFLSHGG